MGGVQCAAYHAALSTGTWVAASLISGAWLAFALWRALEGRPLKSWVEVALVVIAGAALVTWNVAADSLFLDSQRDTYWHALMLYPVGLLLARLAIGIAGMSHLRSRFLVALGLPAGCAAIGYVFVAKVWDPPAGARGLDALPSVWMLLGASAGLWYAFAIARATAMQPRFEAAPMEVIAASALIAIALVWGLYFGSSKLLGQPGGGVHAQYFLAVIATILPRIAIATVFPVAVDAATGDPLAGETARAE